MLKNRFQVLRGRGAVTLAALALVGACGSTKTSFSDNPTGGSGSGSGGGGGQSGWTFLPPTNASGGVSAGGISSGTGGTPAGAGTPGTSGAGGATQLTFKCGGEKPSQPIITAFDGFTGSQWASPGNLAGGVYIYPDTLKASPGDFYALTAEVSTYTGMGVYFNGCIDASKYKGVRFTISGDPGASGTVRFFPVINRNRDVSTEFSVGSCVPDDPASPWQSCHPPELDLPVNSTPTLHYVPWTAFAGGVPAAVTDGSDVLTLEWAFRWLDGDAKYSGQLTVDNLQFYNDEGAGGAGGAGGEGGAPTDPGNEGGAPANPGSGGQGGH